MSAPLRFIVEDLLPTRTAARRWYGIALSQQLARQNPAGIGIEAIVAHGHRDELAELLITSASFDSFLTSFFGSRTVRAAWRHGFPLPLGFGMTHAPSMLAPTFPHDHSNDPGSHLVVTLHDLAAFNPNHADERARQRQEMRIKQAWNYADAIVVPTHALARELTEHYNFGDRLHVISRFPLVSSSPDGLAETPSEPKARTKSTGDYLAYVIDENDLGGISQALQLLTTKELKDAQLLVIDRRAPSHQTSGLLEFAEQQGIDSGRVIHVLPDSIEEYATLLTNAQIAVFTDQVEAHHQALLDAWSLGVPAVGVNTPGFTETNGDAAIVVEENAGVAGLAKAIDTLSRSSKDRERLITRGRDRLTAFNPADVAELVWDLHADLAGA